MKNLCSGSRLIFSWTICFLLITGVVPSLVHHWNTQWCLQKKLDHKQIIFNASEGKALELGRRNDKCSFTWQAFSFSICLSIQMYKMFSVVFILFEYSLETVPICMVVSFHLGFHLETRMWQVLA